MTEVVIVGLDPGMTEVVIVGLDPEMTEVVIVGLDPTIYIKNILKFPHKVHIFLTVLI